jgi:hypothetical protein
LKPRAAGKISGLLAIGLLCLGLIPEFAGAKEPQSISARIARLRADLAGPQSATQVLTRWCADSGLASPPVIKAVPVPGADRGPDAAIRALLKARTGQPIRYRRVRLMCGKQVFSEADNWYLPDKLTADMNQTLDRTDTPFGAVVRPLAFHRKTLAVTRETVPNTILQVRALLLTGDGVPFSLVVENYRRALVSH